MIRKLEVPQEIGEGAEVRVLLWHKRPGDAIAEGDAILELETDKAIVLVISKQSGFVRRCFAGDGEWLKVGQVAAFISDAADEPAPDDRSASVEGMMALFETT